MRVWRKGKCDLLFGKLQKGIDNGDFVWYNNGR